MCADPFSKSVGDGSTAPAHFDSWIQAKSSDAREWYNLKMVPCATVCFANLSLTRQKKLWGENCVNNVRTLTSHQGSRGTWSGRRWCQPRSWGTRLQAEAPAWSVPLCSSDSVRLKREVNLGRTTEEAETTWTNPELGGAREVTPAYSPIRDKVLNAGRVVICTGVFQIIMITYEIFPICNYPPSDNGSSSIYSIANGNIDLQKVLWSGSQKKFQTLAETIRQSGVKLPGQSLIWFLLVVIRRYWVLNLIQTFIL